MKRLTYLLLTCSALSIAPVSSQDDGWISLFDGRTLNGWKVNENPQTFTVVDNAIVAHGPRAHLFYVGEVANHHFTDFEWKADVMTTPGSNSGMYVHTEYQEEGWPEKGIEIQVNNSHTDWRRTGSVYALKDLREPPAKDNEWFTQHIIVKGNKITVKVNGKTVNEYTDTEGKLTGGTIALQGHDPDSKVYYKNIMVRLGR
ncbi:MAG TPA: DUF1080 domain-containing protein [Cyclobacteriaceae bacterium]|nr:DUF1080 domain-containing protein [Cyclobacteriaceae bacterium]